MNSVTTIAWDRDRGILMARSANPVWARERYSANIVWRLEGEE